MLGDLKSECLGEIIGIRMVQLRNAKCMLNSAESNVSETGVAVGLWLWESRALCQRLPVGVRRASV
jgi:hypothetical protein